MSETQKIWFNGELLSDPEARAIMPIDHGLVVGDGVFEALKVEKGGPFALTRHLRRLTKSATAMGLPEPSHDECRRGVAAVLEGRDWDFGKIRITWTGGKGPLGSGKAFGPGTLIVASEAVTRDAPTTRVVTVPWTRNINGALTGVKTTSYGENVVGLAYATEHDATEGIFENTEGFLAEGTGSNIFVVRGGALVTPPLSAGILDGVTRRLGQVPCSGVTAFSSRLGF
ncbi:hypothetical protein BSZ39_12875 [Bowdeniella nasicola]|uniref:4-amino-4-deoxychorismate lyase n=1 Tax=Bowdeniella nasicola TaxID=208480 RepID=A0A1Q5PU85_9ACTO|nr:aminotransferase class IV [Bowdeniella nasicola]OKL51042.1 hypothetical protein BSZ39_12875 [Bowdeniella nasicola]